VYCTYKLTVAAETTVEVRRAKKKRVERRGTCMMFWRCLQDGLCVQRRLIAGETDIS
jgi:hypothetical protein